MFVKFYLSQQFLPDQFASNKRVAQLVHAFIVLVTFQGFFRTISRPTCDAFLWISAKLLTRFVTLSWDCITEIFWSGSLAVCRECLVWTQQ